MNTQLLSFKSNAIAGLGTNTFTVDTAGAYKVSCLSFLTPPTALSIVINLNGSPVVTSITPALSCSEISVGCAVYGAIGDSITVVLSSSNANDSVPNNVRSIISVGRV